MLRSMNGKNANTKVARGYRRHAGKLLASAFLLTVVHALSFPLLGGPDSVLGFGLKEERNGEEAQAGGDHRQAA